MYPQRVLKKIRQQRILHDVTLELTYECNLDCFYCYNDRHKNGRLLSLDQYRSLLIDLADMQTMFIMLTGGEPMIHPNFFEIGCMCNELGFVTRVRTNGHSLTPKIARRVRNEIDPYAVEVSLHGATAEVHDRQTRVPGSFAKLCKNIEHGRDAGLRISVVSTPTAWNEHEIRAMFELCDALQVPLRFQGPVAPRDNGDTEPLSITPSAAAWQEVETLVNQRWNQLTSNHYSIADEDSSGKPEPESTCSVGLTGVDIDPFGNVQACMHLQQSAGSLHQNSIKQIWQESPIFVKARNRAIDAAKQFASGKPEQLGAPVFCIAVEENMAKGKKHECGQCSRAENKVAS